MEQERYHVSGGAYVLTFAALLALATASLLVSELNWPTANLVIALVVAVGKSALVLFFFMHLIEQRFTNRATVLVSIGFVVLLIGLTVADVASRHTFPARTEPTAVERFYVR